MSTRARRTRKSAGQEEAVDRGRLERQTSKDNRRESKEGWRDSKDDISKKISHDRSFFSKSNQSINESNFSTLKRRNTGKKMDADKVYSKTVNIFLLFIDVFFKAKTAASRDGKEKKISDTRKPVRSR